ncbi:MAG: hypothetical protein JNN08_08355 [Bryobacterales bacterium]|nr:hypothetical protein [Bryobacterales bacterium]
MTLCGTRYGWGAAASPLVNANRVYIVSDSEDGSFMAADGDTNVIEAGPAVRVLGKNSLDEMTLVTPAIAQGSLILRTATRLYRIGSKP